MGSSDKGSNEISLGRAFSSLPSIFKFNIDEKKFSESIKFLIEFLFKLIFLFCSLPPYKIPGTNPSTRSLFISPEVLVSLVFALKVVILNSISKKCFLTYQ